ncbi:MAG: helicase HerA-like domain-containing protein [Ignavibacteria bacterium]
MADKDKFIAHINEGYNFKGEYIVLGTAILEKEALPAVHIKLPLKTLNRHGLIAGATGTGKTKTLQILAEGFSSKSIPVFVMDIKGDFSGIAMPGVSNDKITERMNKIGIPFEPSGFPVEFLTISNEKGARMRATVSEFGPVLFSKMLGLNDAQTGVMAMIFKYCDDNKLPLLDLKDMVKMLQYISNEGKNELQKSYGNIATTSVGTILRKVIELEQQGADKFFGETSFEVEDLVRTDDQGKGIISIIRLTDIQSKPKLFSTFLLCLLVEIYNTFPEAGDLDQPKLVMFIDEAHLIFNEATKELLDQIEAIIKLIRSKGVGIFFCTQNPVDIPEAVLAQLGLKIQHALRAFTAKDRKQIKLIAENYPLSDFYKTEDMLTSLGTGEAAISVLNEKGNPAPLSATLVCAPRSRMDILTPEEINSIVSKSKIVPKYNEVIDRESAFEILKKKLEESEKVAEEEKVEKEKEKPKEPSTVEKVLKSTAARQVGTTVARELTRGLLGVLGLGGSTRKKKSWF